MKTNALLATISLILILLSCSKKAEYTPEFISETSGRYLYTPDEVIEVYYDNSKLFLKWRGVEKIKPVTIDQNTFFVADMYKKLRFVKHPQTKRFYLSVVDPDQEELISYDYLKLADSMHIPSVYLEKGEYDKALAGYLDIKKQDSMSSLINEGDFNRLGYRFLREKKYEQSISVFKINVALYPESSNVYDSLADAFLRSGDSLQAFNYYSEALERNNSNTTAKQYVEAYNTTLNQ